MYTAVLMLAMTTGAESVDFGRRGGGCSGYGCSSYSCSGYRGGCSGGGYYRSCSCSSSYGGGYYGGCTGAYRTCSSGCSGYSSTPVYYQGGIATTMPYAVNTPATIVVEVPANARVSFDGNATSSTGERRTFVTPSLDPGSTYVYTIRAEIVSNGQTAIEARDVIVRAGQTAQVRFDPVLQGTAGR